MDPFGGAPKWAATSMRRHLTGILCGLLVAPAVAGILAGLLGLPADPSFGDRLRQAIIVAALSLVVIAAAAYLVALAAAPLQQRKALRQIAKERGQELSSLRVGIHRSLCLMEFSLNRTNDERDPGLCVELNGVLTFQNAGPSPISYAVRSAAIEFGGQEVLLSTTDQAFHIWPGQENLYVFRLGCELRGAVEGRMSYTARYGHPDDVNVTFEQTRSLLFANRELVGGSGSRTTYWTEATEDSRVT